jgi:hypothetical protein
MQQDQKSNVMLTQVESDAMLEMIANPGARGLVVIVAHVGLFLDARCQGQQPRQAARQQSGITRTAFHIE